MAAKAPLVLVVEDDPEMVRLLSSTLKREGYRVLVAQDGPTALEMATEHQLALVLLDLGLPGLDGYTVLERIREFSEVPVIIITARGQDEAKGLDAGADDYVAKPFDVNHLLARIRAVLRRARPAEEKPRARYEYDGLVVDFAWHQVTLHGELLRLAPTDYRILSTLASHPGLPHTPQQLLETIWGPEYVTDGRQILNSAMNRLRGKLEPDPQRPRYVLTVPGIGYCVPRPA